MMKEVMSRDAYYGILEQVENTVEESEQCDPYTVRNAFDEYTLHYEYDGDGVYMFDLLDEDGVVLFSSEGDLKYSQEDFKHKLRKSHFDMTRELLKV